MRKSSFHRDVDSQTRLTSVPPSPLHLPRLEELDNAPQPQREEQWSTVSKNALPKTVAKTAAKAPGYNDASDMAIDVSGLPDSEEKEEKKKKKKKSKDEKKESKKRKSEVVDDEDVRKSIKKAKKEKKKKDKLKE